MAPLMAVHKVSTNGLRMKESLPGVKRKGELPDGGMAAVGFVRRAVARYRLAQEGPPGRPAGSIRTDRRQ